MNMQLRVLFDEAAVSQTPDDLAARAVAGARRRRRQRYTVAGSALAAATVVLGFVLFNPPERLDGSPRPNDVAGVPDELPAAEGLPTLRAGAMASASAAYVVGGKVVVIDGATGAGAVVDVSSSADSVPGDVAPAIGPDASVALSPNGRFLMVSSGKLHWEVGSPREWIWMVDVATGTVAAQNFQLAPAKEDSSVVLNRMAWSPNGMTFACVCSFPGGRQQLNLMQTTELGAGDLVFNSAESVGVAPRQISWGTDGLAVQLDGVNGQWRVVPESQDPGRPARWPLPGPLLGNGGFALMTSMVMAHSADGGFLAVVRGGNYWLVNDVDYQESNQVGTRAMVGSLGDSYYAVFTDWKGDPADDSVTRIDASGETALTTLPAGVTAISFASELVD